MRVKFIHGQALILLIVSVVAPLSGWAADSKDLETFKAQFRQLRATLSEKADKDTASPGPSEAEVRGWLAMQHPDGSWPDIDYANTSRADWKTINHLVRVQSLATTYARNRIQGKDDPALLHGVLSGLDYWTVHRFQCSNWWYQTIGTPIRIADILLLVEDRLPPKLKTDALSLVNPPFHSGGGTNLAWTAGCAFKKAALTGDVALARTTRDIVVRLLATTTKEGIQPDESYHMHGSQQQFGNYGLGFYGDLIGWAAAWRGTSFALTDKEVALLRDFALQGEALTVANGIMDISACGRTLGRTRTTTSGGKTVLNGLSLMAEVDPAHVEEYRAAIAHGSAPAGTGSTVNRVFYRSDYAAHRRPDYFATLKMCSNRVLGGESINGENLRGHFLPDGAVFLYQTGKEYTDIFPVWDWRRIPGVTCVPTGPVHGPSKMDTDYAGGVSDGTYGACGFAYNHDGVTGKKAWFFFDHQIVCLGADLTAAKGEPIATTLEQCLLNGPVSSSAGTSAGQPLPTGEQHLSDARWVWHNNRGYFFPTSQKVVARNAAQTGNWNNVRSGDEPEPVPISKHIFSLWLDHGANAANAAYSYVILPAMSAEQVATYAAHSQMTVLANTGGVQAVKDTETNLVATVFYGAGSIETGVGPLTADAPCAVLLRKGAQGYSLTASDPSQKDAKLTLTFGGKTLNVLLPTGDAAGSSVNVPVR